MARLQTTDDLLPFWILNAGIHEQQGPHGLCAKSRGNLQRAGFGRFGGRNSLALFYCLPFDRQPPLNSDAVAVRYLLLLVVVMVAACFLIMRIGRGRESGHLVDYAAKCFSDW